MTIRVEVLEGSRLPELRAQWLDLLPAHRSAFFVHPDWCRVTWESHYPRAKVKLHVAFEADRVVGLLPTCHRNMNRFGLFLPVVEGFAGGRGDYSVPLTGQTTRLDVVKPLLESAIRSARRAGTLMLWNMPVETGVPRALEELLQASDTVHEVRDASCLKVPLPPDSEEALAGLKTSLRADMRRRTRRIEEALGPLAYSVASSQSEAEALLPAFFEMHDRRWLEQGLPGAFSESAARSWFQRMIDDLWDQGLHFSKLQAGDRTIALHFGMVSHGWLLYFKPTFDPQFHAFSPGKLHLRALLEDAAARGLEGIDMLQGHEGYKREWADEVTECQTFLIRTSRASVSYPWLTRARPWLEDVVGPGYRRVVARLQAMRQKDH